MRHMTFFASYAVHMESVNIRQENCSHGKQDYISSIDIEGPCKPCLITIFMIHENLDLLAAIGRPDRARNYSFCLSLCKFGHYILDQSFHWRLGMAFLDMDNAEWCHVRVFLSLSHYEDKNTTPSMGYQN